MQGGSDTLSIHGLGKRHKLALYLLVQKGIFARKRGQMCCGIYRSKLRTRWMLEEVVVQLRVRGQILDYVCAYQRRTMRA
jgi:hypothetical protein